MSSPATAASIFSSITSPSPTTSTSSTSPKRNGTAGFTGRSRAIAYSAAKGGVANLTRAMAVQLAPHKVRVNAIVPNKIGSPVGKDEFDASRPVPNMAKRPGEPVEAAKAVLFLVTDDSSFVWGANLFVDGGVSAMDLS